MVAIVFPESRRSPHSHSSTWSHGRHRRPRTILPFDVAGANQQRARLLEAICVRVACIRVCRSRVGRARHWSFRLAVVPLRALVFALFSHTCSSIPSPFGQCLLGCITGRRASQPYNHLIPSCCSFQGADGPYVAQPHKSSTQVFALLGFSPSQNTAAVFNFGFGDDLRTTGEALESTSQAPICRVALAFSTGGHFDPYYLRLSQ